MRIGVVRMMRKLTVAGAAVSCAASVSLGAVVAEATTGDNTGLPPPKVELSNHIGSVFAGRFFLKRAPRKAKVTAAQLDIALVTESIPVFYFGELTLRTYTSSGAPTTELLDLWWFYFHKKDDRLTARVIPPATVSPTHDEGEAVGQISFAVPGGRSGLANHGVELKQLSNAQLTLKGRGTYPLTFVRTGDDSPDVLKIPPAELYGH